MSAPRTLYDKIFDDHLVDRQDDGTCLLWIDRHLVHEVTSPQAFEKMIDLNGGADFHLADEEREDTRRAMKPKADNPSRTEPSD